MLQEWHSSSLAPVAATTVMHNFPFLSSVAAAWQPSRRWRRPDINLNTTIVSGRTTAVRERVVLEKPFCRFLHFERDTSRHDARIFVIAPLSGHFSALLHDLLAALLPEHDVYLADWTDARDVPLKDGRFGIEENIGYVIESIRRLGDDLHLIALCQSAMPTLAAAAVLASATDAVYPRTMTLISGMLDPRINPTRIDRQAVRFKQRWLKRFAIETAPPPFPGKGRRVYSASAQHTALLAYLARHIATAGELLRKVLDDDGDDAASHPFVERYLSVMDLPAELFLDTIRVVFRKSALAQGQLTFNRGRVDPSAITRTSLLTIEGENDDVSGRGQTRAAHDLCSNIPADRRAHYVQPGVGHFGTFYGRAWRTEVMPRVREFIRGSR